MNQKEFKKLECLEKIIKRCRAKKVFIVSGRKSYENSGAKKRLKRILKREIIVSEFSSFSSNPKLNEIQKGLKLFNKFSPDIIIAIGGGSAIDVAKAIKLFSLREIPLVAVPTTTGSGSEATYFIVYYIEKRKQSKGEMNITLPNYIILDPDLLKSLPKKVIASSGIDALGQAIESYWSINSTRESKKYAKRAIKILMKHLVLATRNKDPYSLKKIQKAANLSGKAINITKTTACHALAYPMTSYFGIPHGHAVGLTLGEMLLFNFSTSNVNCLDKRGPDHVKQTIHEISKILYCKTPSDAKNKIYDLMGKIGLENSFSKLGIKKSNLRAILNKGFNSHRIKNNPRAITKEEMKKILENRL